MSFAAESIPSSTLADSRRSYVLSRWVFLRLLGLVYLLAFWSFGIQMMGLIGEHGILPVGEYLHAARAAYGLGAYWQAPTLCWLSDSDTMLLFLAVGGAVLAGLLILDIAPKLVLAMLWTFYLSLTVAGQIFLGFQWDALLLETGLLAVFYAPAGWWPRLGNSREPPALARWLLWLLLFKLMLLSGVTKLLSGDPTWRDGTALTYHYQTQPIPTWTSWYAHQWPMWVHKCSTVNMYVIEIVAPLFILVPPRLRMLRLIAAALMVLLQAIIAATGNYGFFNLLSMVVCLTLIDDGVWRKIWPVRRAPSLPLLPERPAWRWAAIAAACLILPLSGLSLVREIVYTLPGRAYGSLGWADTVAARVAPLRSINGYGLFRVMTTQRPEIVIEGSHDGQIWHEYGFPYKPGDVDRRPKFCAPFMPRLDWQMWFAALNPQGNQGWLLRLAEHLLRGTPEVRALLSDDPFGGRPPKYVRLVLYDYRYAPPESGSRAWWGRQKLGELTSPLSLKTK